MVRKTSLLVGTTALTSLVLVAIFASAAFGQTPECRAAAADQYGDCGSAPVTIVPQPEPPEPGGGDTNTAEVGTQTINQVAETRTAERRTAETRAPVVVDPQVSPPASPAVPSTDAPYPTYGSAEETSGVSEVSALPETGGVSPLPALLAGALLLGTTILAGRWILRMG